MAKQAADKSTMLVLTDPVSERESVSGDRETERETARDSERQGVRDTERQRERA